MKKFVCPVCGYVYEGEFIPEGFKCPVCGVDGSKFKVMEEGKLAAEHEYGIYAKTVKNNPDISEEDKKYIFEQLLARSYACSSAERAVQLFASVCSREFPTFQPSPMTGVISCAVRFLLMRPLSFVVMPLADVCSSVRLDSFTP